MSVPRTLYACGCLLLSACVQAPVFETHNHAVLGSNYPVVRLNGEAIEPSYRLDLAAGSTVAVIVYNTYQFDYHCTFSWEAKSGTVYEVTDQENRYPLTLYRWVRTNSLWASRLESTDPLDCVKKKRGSA